MGDVIENLITLVLWIVASYYLRSKRPKSEPQTPSPKPAPTQPQRRVERDPLEESARRRPRYPASLDDLDEKELQLWEDRLLEYAEASGLIEDEDGWEVPWSGYRYYDLDELFELYVHRQGKPLQPPAELVLVEGPNGEQMPVLVPREPDESEAELEPEPAPSSASDDGVRPSAPSEQLVVPTIVIARLREPLLNHGWKFRPDGGEAKVEEFSLSSAKDSAASRWFSCFDGRVDHE